MRKVKLAKGGCKKKGSPRKKKSRKRGKNRKCNQAQVSGESATRSNFWGLAQSQPSYSYCEDQCAQQFNGVERNIPGASSGSSSVPHELGFHGSSLNDNSVGDSGIMAGNNRFVVDHDNKVAGKL